MWALVTGAGRGLGRELAILLAERGCDIVLHGRNPTDLMQTAEALSRYGRRHIRVEGDLRDESVVDALCVTAEEIGASILVNNAGIPCPGKSIEELYAGEVRDILHVNLIVPIILSKFFIENELAIGGGIISINSILGLEVKPKRSIYGAGRFGLRAFMNSIALELDGRDVRILSVYPSRIRTRPEYSWGMDAQEVAEKIVTQFFQGRENELVIDGRPCNIREERYEQS